MQVKLMQNEDIEADYPGYAPIEHSGKGRAVFGECAGQESQLLTGVMVDGVFCNFTMPVTVSKTVTPHVEIRMH